MATMDVTPPAVIRLFSRLDFGAAPTQGVLAALLDRWNAACGGMPFPRASVITKQPTLFPSGFVFRRLEGERDYVLVMGLATAEAMLGSLGADGRLSGAENRRAAVRLRRLFAEALRTSEPFIAQFILKNSGPRRRRRRYTRRTAFRRKPPNRFFFSRILG